MLFPIGKLLVADGLPDTDPQKATLLRYIADYAAYTAAATSPAPSAATPGTPCRWPSRPCKWSGPTPPAIRDYLEGIQNFAGISGIFNLSAQDHNGIGKESLVMVQIVDGGWAYVAPETYADTP